MNHLDLFTGIGGFTLAAQWAGINTVAFCEVNEWCNENALKRNWPDIPNLKDIRKLCRRIHHNLDETKQDYDDDYVECSRCSGKDYENGGVADAYGIDFGDCECIGTDQFNDEHENINLITAGVPCQPASIIGKRKGIDDSRWLWPDTFRVIEELMPEWVVCENPTGILTLNGGDRFGEIIERFQQTGYSVWWETIPASAIGAGHRRERVWIVAYTGGEGLERHARHEGTHDRQEREKESAIRSIAPEIILPHRDAPQWWKDKSPVQVVVDGVPSPAFWKQSVIATGNAIVPQVAFQILKSIREIYELSQNT